MILAVGKLCGSRARAARASLMAGLPVGLQITGPPRREALAMPAAAALEAGAGIHRMLPIDPRSATTAADRKQGHQA